MVARNNIVSEQTERSAQHGFSLAFWLILLSIAVIGSALLLPQPHRIIEPVLRIDVETTEILNAIHSYKADFGAFPAGDSRAVFRALRGQNSRKIVYFQCSPKSLSSEGDLLDPWGTPYKLYFSGDEVLIRSAGSDKHFEDSGDKHFDDYIR